MLEPRIRAATTIPDRAPAVAWFGVFQRHPQAQRPVGPGELRAHREPVPACQSTDARPAASQSHPNIPTVFRVEDRRPAPPVPTWPETSTPAAAFASRT